MKREYQLSRRIIVVLTIIVSAMIFVNEDVSVKTVGIGLFTLVAWVSSHLGAGVSRKMIQTGDKISNVWFRFIFYLFLFVLFLAFAILIFILATFVYDAIPHSNDFEAALGDAMVFVFACAAMFVLLLVPYIQTLVVLFFRKK